MRALILFVATAAALMVGPGRASAQDGWNEARTRALVERARATRAAVVEDDSLRNYAAEARGYVYFYVDRRDTDETALVKTDQVALEVYWKAPDSTKQRIVGLRDEESLPTNIQYHLDHLTVVQDDYADLIRLGDGDEVAAVVHPMAPGSQAVYDFRLADSISIDLGAAAEPIRVYEVEVRPTDFSRPGFVGSVFLDRESAAIVRMNFTFTSASYVDDYLDYIRISLDNSLWDGRYWLPYEQRVELRRELPYLDFPAGSVIRGRYEIRNYDFNGELPAFLFVGGRVSALPQNEREQFPFEEELHAQVDEEGLGPLPELADIRAEAARMAGAQALSGLGRFRPWIPNSSWLVRSSRAEGTRVGVGAAYRFSDATRVGVGAGYAFGRKRPFATARMERVGPVNVVIEASLSALGEIGGRPTASSAFNTLAVLTADRDYTDPFFSSGAKVTAQHTRASVEWSASLEAREDRSGELVTLVRPVRAVDEGTLLEVGLGVRTRALTGPGAGARVHTGRIEGRAYVTSEGETFWSYASLENGVYGTATLRGGWTSPGAPLQTRALLGGRATLLGYPYRGFGGDRWALLHTEGSKSVVEPWLRLGAFASVGSTWLRDGSVPVEWAVQETGQARFSAGLTAHAFWDLLRIDFGRGLNGGDWEAQLSLAKRFWPWL